jgi:hypothetical protein
MNPRALHERDPRAHAAHKLSMMQTWFNSEQIRADLSEPDPL